MHIARLRVTFCEADANMCMLLLFSNNSNRQVYDIGQEGSLLLTVG